MSADPGPELVPATARTETGTPGESHQWPIIAGLAAHADDPEEREPLDDPQPLLGEVPALGSNGNPG